jgi:hypothetical protein
MNRSGTYTEALTGPHSRFAVITAAGNEPPYLEPTYVELDGCLRVLAGDGSLRQAGPELIETLTDAVART